jgi:membrane associated rhomboid family serine protease
MLVPYGDNLTKGRVLFGVALLISLMLVIDVPAFLNANFEEWSIRYLGFVPVWFSASPWGHIHTLLTSVFLHQDIFHLAGNCLFLWAFGRSLERLFGTPLFLVTFPFLGIDGLLVHWSLFPASEAAVIGASGAIATLMGAYLTLFPSARMRMLLFLGIAYKRFQVPAWLFILYWSALQVLSLMFGGGEDHVAYAVHIGGFAVGVLSAMVWKVSYPFAEERLSVFLQTALVSSSAPNPPPQTAAAGQFGQQVLGPTHFSGE